MKTLDVQVHVNVAPKKYGRLNHSDNQTIMLLILSMC